MTLHTHEIFITGGGQVYHEALPLAGRVYLTRVHTTIADADTWFPPLDEAQWQRRWIRPFEADDKHAFAYQFEYWERVAAL
jgi:dihydrofolate reductase